MDKESVTSRIDAVCRELNLDTAVRERIVAELERVDAGHSPRTLKEIREEIERLRSEVEEARSERERIAQVEAEVMKLLGTTSRDKILHDLRNVLNDLALLQEITGER